MSSRRGGSGKPATANVNVSSPSPSSKGKNVAAAADNAEQLSHAIADVTLDSSSKDDGHWEEVIAKKSKNRAGSTAAKQWLPHNSLSNNPKPWGPRNTNNSTAPPAPPNTWSSKAAPPKRPPVSAPGGNSRHFETAYRAPQPVITPPLQHGWNWQSRAASASQLPQATSQPKDDIGPSDDLDPKKNNETYDDDDDSDVMEDDSDDDDELLSDEFDSDSSEKSHNTLKKSNWFGKFFKIIEELKIDEINDPERQWHCPACRGGPGAIDWYRGLQPLMTHAKTKGGHRLKLHRKFAEVLEDELQRIGTSVVPPGEAFGRWKGLQDEEKDYEIVWPPMVVVMNTKLEQDENDKVNYVFLF